jgi:chemotaxis methyl-accepting protein methylase
VDHLDRIRHVLLEKFGLATISRPDLVRALERMLCAHPEHSAAMVGQVEQSPALLRELAGHVTLSESYFARHPDQIDAVVSHLLPRIAAGQKVAIWSAGCARGEEPLTLALKLSDACGPEAMSRVQIVGSDIDGASIEVARSGLFSQWSLRTATPEVLRHFERQANGQYRIRKALLDVVEFHHASIQDHVAQFAPRSFTVILFRNVGIYLSSSALGDIHRAFHRVLTESGLLAQAATDPLPSSQWFHSHNAPAPGLMHPVTSSACAVNREPSFRAAVICPKASVRRDKPQTSCLSSGRIATSRERRLSSVPTFERELALPVPRPKQSLASAQARIEEGEALAAVEALRATLYLTPEDHLARYWYCIALRAANSSAKALQQARSLRVEIGRSPKDQMLSDELTTIGELRQAVEELLEEMQ